MVTTNDPAGQGLSPRFVVVMGVSGVGKSTIAAALADRLGASFIEADELHPPENVAWMAAGNPLQDEHRWPWLDRVCERALTASSETGGRVVVACSALKARYRDVFRRRLGDVLFLHLDGSVEEIRRRMELRKHHFMPASLLDSQMAALEAPVAEADAATLSVERPVEAIVEAALAEVRSREGAAR